MRERGPQKSLAAERSFPPLPSEAAAAVELAPLAQTLLARAAEVRPVCSCDAGELMPGVLGENVLGGMCAICMACASCSLQCRAAPVFCPLFGPLLMI